MLKIYKSQNGFALILVLLTIVIIGILAPPLVNRVISNANQVQISEEMIQKNKLIDMGKLVARATIENKINSLPTNVNDALNELRTFLIPYEPTTSLSGSNYNPHYEINYVHSEILYDKNTQVLQIPYTVTAKLISKSNPSTIIGKDLTVREVYKIQLNTTGSTIDWQTIDDSDFTNRSLFPNQMLGKHPSNINGNTNFTGTVQTKNSSTFTVYGSAALQNGAHFSNNGTMIVSKSFYSNGGTLQLQNDSKIIIGNNAWFYNVNFTFHKNSFICVEGNIYGNYHIKATHALNKNSCAEVSGQGLFYIGKSFPLTETADSGSGGSGAIWSPIGTY